MTDGSRLPGTADDDGSDPIVLHVDMDCFYAACERRREPELRGEPVVVGMGYEDGENHGAVATASYEAREYGVESAQAISTALERLPRRAEVEASVEAGEDPAVDPDETGYYRPVDMDHYESVSEEVKEILHDSADVVREVSIDEAYLDVTSRTAWEVAEGFARHVKNRIDREVGVTASVGVAPNMSAAKIASDHDKPDGLVVVEPGDVRAFLADLDVAEIHGVGPVTARELRDMGVETASDLADADRGDLLERFGERGAEMHRRARGEDEREVTPTGEPKSLSRESAFNDPTDDGGRKRERVRTLAAAVADRATRRDAMYRTIGIKAVRPPYDVNTRAKSLPGPVDDPDLVEEVALELLDEFADDEVRKVGVRVSNLSFADADQASLGDGWDAADRASGSGAPEGATAESPAGATAESGDDSAAGRPADSAARPLDEYATETADGDDRAGAASATPSDDDSAPSGQASLRAAWDRYESEPADSDGGERSDEGVGAGGEGDDEEEGGETNETGDADPQGQASLVDFD